MGRIEDEFRQQDLVAAFVDLEASTCVSRRRKTPISEWQFGVYGFADDDVPKTGTWRAAVTEAEKTGVEQFKGSGRWLSDRSASVVSNQRLVKLSNAGVRRRSCASTKYARGWSLRNESQQMTP